MNFPVLDSFSRKLAHAGLLVVCVAALAIGGAAQFKTRSFSVLLAPENESANLDHCANGQLGSTPQLCSDVNPDNNWVNGQLGSNKAHYFEGDSVPYRAVMTGLSNNATYTVQIEYDLTKQGKYAFDYLTSYDRTENAMNVQSGGQPNPCGDVISSCTDATAHSTVGIPDDPTVNPPSGQIAGNFEMWGGTIMSIGTYGLNGTVTDTSSRTISVTFKAGGSSVVLTWGAHIATRKDWGDNMSAVAISGSSYHVALDSFTDSNGNALGLGQQDHQLSVDAIFSPAEITIIKLVTEGPVPVHYSSSQSFPFTISTTGTTTPPTGFSLMDSDPSQTLGGQQSVTTVSFGTNITIGESVPANWNLIDLTCTAVDNGGFSQTGTRTINFPANPNVTFNLLEGNRVTCTFSNSNLRATAAPASVTGRVVDSFGNAVSKARISVVDAENGSTRVVMTSPFGYYTIDQLDSGRFYIVTVSARGYKFADNTRSFTLTDSLADMDFVANP